MNKEKILLFENEYLISKKITNEVCKKLLKKSVIIGYILGLFNIMGYVISMYYLKEVNYYILAIGFGCLFFSFFLPYINSKKIIDYFKVINKGKLETTKIKFEDNIKVYRGMNYSEYDYNQIVSTVETVNTLVLIIGAKEKNAKLQLIILKDGFNKGTYEEFVDFINNKIQ